MKKILNLMLFALLFTSALDVYAELIYLQPPSCVQGKWQAPDGWRIAGAEAPTCYGTEKLHFYYIINSAPSSSKTFSLLFNTTIEGKQRGFVRLESESFDPPDKKDWGNANRWQDFGGPYCGDQGGQATILECPVVRRK
jgi:hypothetical protein